MSFGVNVDPLGVRILGVFLVLIPLFVIISFMFPFFVSVMVVNFLLLYLIVLFILLYIQNPEESKPRELTKAYSLAVMVPTFNSLNTIEKCIASIKAMKYPVRFRIIVADDGSTDGSRELLRKMKGIELLELPHKGKGDAMNEALKRINEEVIVSIDSDTYPTSDTLMKLVGYLDDPKIGAVTARLIPDQRRTFIQRVQFLEYLMGFGFWNNVLSTVNIMSYVTGPLTIFRRSALKEAGYYFDPKNLAEDMDVGLRLQKKGYKIKVCASVFCETDVPDSVGKLVKQRDRWYRSRVYNLIKYRSLFFNKVNPNLGFFGLPYLFMVEMLMIVILIRVAILLLLRFFEWVQMNALVIFVGNVFPRFAVEFAVETQAYFFIAAIAALSIQYYLGLRLVGYSLKRSDILPLFFQLIVYPYFIAFIYLRGMFREFKGAKPVWERVST